MSEPSPIVYCNAVIVTLSYLCLVGPSVLEELSKMKAKRTNPFGKPKL